MLHGLRRQALKTQTQWYNSVRAHLSERGLVVRRSKAQLDGLIERVLSDNRACGAAAAVVLPCRRP